ncbi:hypothetical protein UFOVP53_77 [uncultured Caudovirales phage]|uniref:Uncharacterized protein n=1 Tax=uncultured Caudovirales phage TaxID=2100421 RepID=A0A6J5KY88_9CAUD|nr:hypothetical protein UFOVP53_77 [uncultured Caudovirales phage]
MASKDNDKTDLIYDLVKENRQDMNDFRKEVKEDSDQVKERLSNIEHNSALQNQHLAEHMRRTNILEQLHRDNSTRIQKLEEPKIVLNTLKKWFIGLGAIAGAIVAIMKLLGKI